MLDHRCFNCEVPVQNEGFCCPECERAFIHRGDTIRAWMYRILFGFVALFWLVMVLLFLKKIGVLP